MYVCIMYVCMYNLENKEFLCMYVCMYVYGYVTLFLDNYWTDFDAVFGKWSDMTDFR